MKHTLKRLALSLLLAAALFSAGCEKKNQDPVKVLKLSHGLDISHPVHHAMEFMAKRVAEKSNGTMRIDIYPGEQLGSERDSLELLQLGCLAMTKTSSSALESFANEFKVLGLPYLFRDVDHYWKVLLGPIGKELLLSSQHKNLRGLCFYDAGARSFYAKTPINSPEDLKGQKIRTQPSDMAMRMVEAMGASPTPISWGELYTSLQQGVVDGAENNPPSLYTSRHYEVCKFYSLDEHTRPPDVILISTFVWNELTPEQQNILQEAADESSLYGQKLWDEFVQKSMEEIQKNGVSVVHPDKKPFRDAVQNMWKNFEGTKIGDLAKQIEEVQ